MLERLARQLWRECCLWGKAFGFYLMQWEATEAYKTGSETKILFGVVHEH